MKQAKAIFVMLVLVLLTLLSSCKLGTSQNMELAVCGSYAVPGMFCYELKGGTYSCEILEEDSQGRILFEYVAKDHISSTEKTAYVICQGIDSEYVYFYEDICYAFSPADEEALKALKEQNHWDLPLEQERMSRRKNSVTLDLFISLDCDLEYSKVRDACCKELGIEASQIKELCFLDGNGASQELYLLCAEEQESQRSYFVFADISYSVSVMEIPEQQISTEEIMEFKEVNGWKYS